MGEGRGEKEKKYRSKRGKTIQRARMIKEGGGL